ncbi:metal-dependent transcriptional regulator [Niabella sp. W65]|nr:metal-dependent transcriptional regulator [Niabella sp. W65]MCH7367330.1 metal-dependent transcriptional regulator [Niabella sp. W65]PZR30371.1 MAG: iron (metal) dependent repressor, dtxr family protein [Azospira oryzae]ULT42990.1 metal-dependent transcriptional regulator [Niabella sp. I65]
MNTHTEENYLKAIFNLSATKGEANVNELSRQLDIKMPTVNSMMKKLSDRGLIIYESYKPVRLTKKGQKEAAMIIRKHRLTEMYLVEKMGFGWDEVHDIAEQIEHVQSPEFFAKMDELLGYPKVDPHGSPIPDRNGKMEWTEYHKLNECKPGDTVIFKAVTHSSDDFLKFLNTRELLLETVIKVISIESFDGTITVEYNKRKQELLSNIVCDKILVSHKKTRSV